jgi:DNA-binding transcriptional regulator LsrR (DeoR family)
MDKQDKILEVIALLNQQMSDNDIAKSLKVPVAEVREMKAKAIESGAYKRRVSIEERRANREQVADYLRKKEGSVTVSQVAEKFGVSASYVEKVKKSAGLSSKYHGRQVGSMQVLAEWIEGATVSQIADKHNITRQAVSAVMALARKEGLIGAIEKAIKAGKSLPAPGRHPTAR